jgi:hypothetical protein
VKRRTMKKRAARIRRADRLVRKWLEGHHTRLDAHVLWLQMGDVLSGHKSESTGEKR